MKSTIMMCSTIFCAAAMAHPGHSSNLYTLIHPETMLVLMALIPLVISASRRRMLSSQWERKMEKRIKSD
jgi:hypothetical protein